MRDDASISPAPPSQPSRRAFRVLVSSVMMCHRFWVHGAKCIVVNSQLWKDPSDARPAPPRPPPQHEDTLLSIGWCSTHGVVALLLLWPCVCSVQSATGYGCNAKITFISGTLHIFQAAHAVCFVLCANGVVVFFCLVHLSGRRAARRARHLAARRALRLRHRQGPANRLSPSRSPLRAIAARRPPWRGVRRHSSTAGGGLLRPQLL